MNFEELIKRTAARLTRAELEREFFEAWRPRSGGASDAKLEAEFKDQYPEPPVPEGRLVEVVVVWTASSTVRIPVPSSTRPEDELAAVQEFIDKNGLPEVVDNPTIDFMFGQTIAVGDVEAELDD